MGQLPAARQLEMVDVLMRDLRQAAPDPWLTCVPWGKRTFNMELAYNTL